MLWNIFITYSNKYIKIIFNQIYKLFKAERENKPFSSQWMTSSFIQFSPLCPPGIIKLNYWNKSIPKYCGSAKTGNDLYNV